MKKALLVVLSVVLLFSQLDAQTRTPRSSRTIASRVIANPQIQRIVREISAANIETTIRKLVGFGTRHSLSETDSEKRGIGAARRWIKSEFDRYNREGGGRLQVEFDEFTQQPTQRIPKATELVNVVATLPGKQLESKERIYVVSGHYDSCVCAQDTLDGTTDAPGANDDASGTAAVMEIARVMSKYEFDATLVFMTVAAEEQGLNGSTHWAEVAKQKNLNVAGMITNDIIGSSRAEDGHIDNTHVRLFAGELPARGEITPGMRALMEIGGENDSPTRQLARYIKEIGEQYVRPMKVNVIYRRDRYGRGGDHSPFLDRGIPAVRMTEPNENLKHQHQKVRKESGVQYGDLPEFVDFNFVAQVARVNAAALASLALGPSAPANVLLEASGSPSDAILRWDSNKEPDVIGYQIVWRETTSPFWQNRIKVGNVTRYTVKGVSRDNYLFGVQAIDKDGNTSVAVYPKPYRRPRANDRQAPTDGN
jgi:hypothetical protein